MNLLAKGYLLIAFPLVCHIMFVAFLGTQLWQIKENLIAVHRTQQIVGKTQHLISEMVPIFAEVNYKTDIDLQRTELRKRVGDIQQLADMTIGTPEHAAFENLLERTRGQQRLIDWIDHQQRVGWTDQTRNMLDAKLWEQTHSLTDAAAGIISAQEQRAQTLPRVKPMEASVTYTLNTALVVSIFASIALAFYYALTIRKPLMHLMTNGQLLSGRRDLEPELVGTDELSQLDGLFHRVSDAISQATAKERDLFLNATDLICSINTNGIFTRVNPFAHEMLAIAPADLTGTSIIDLVVPEDCASVDRWLSHMIDGRANDIVEFRLKKEGAEILTQWSSFFSAIDASLFCVAHDITELRQVEQLKKDFVNMVAHDLRSPLTSLLGSMTLISEGVLGELPDEAMGEVVRAERNIEKVIGFVNDLLDFQKMQDGKLSIKRKEHDLAEVVKDAVRMVQTVGDAQGVGIEIPEGTFIAQFDSERLLQVVVNLLANAIKFSPQQKDAKIEVKIQDLVDSIRLSVRDHGPGVPAAMQQSIFEPFVQLPGEQMSQGTGLGLAICKLILEAHEGSVGVQDAIGGGAEFWIQFPKK
jgi:PAS domain S-box-containing protein